ncbi:Ku protein [Streptomyces sp. NPDC085659]|uniref:non-homologous end joining protein Ku n=1 Tax=Streptomyces sp. NPDC085659 TaxID=3155177 RepID=UPI00344CDD13
MPRPLWSGAISFGLVTIPTKIISATEDHSIHFRRVHLKDMGRVRTRKICELDEKELSQEEIGKGYEVSKDEVVPVTDRELQEMPLPTAKAIEIVAFVDADTIDPVRIGESYYLGADGQVAAKPYTLLRKALERSAKVAIAKWAWHGRERLGLLQVKGGAIVLHAMHWPDEVRSPESLAPKQVELHEAEIEQAVQLAESMTTDDIAQFRDHYRDALEELIEAKSEGKERPEPPEAGGAGESGKVMDLMAALNASVTAAKEKRGESGEDAIVHEIRPRKKSPAKKPAAKKTATKKTTASKPEKKRSAS